MPLTTLAPRTKLPTHSAGWRALRIVSDRAGKGKETGPGDWLKTKHRYLTLDQQIQIIQHRARIIRHIASLRES
jgi:hypothetical protein